MTSNSYIMKTLKSNLTAVVFVFAFAFLLMHGCKTEENKPAPQLPPEASFVMNFEDFSNADDTTGMRNIDSYQHWGRAFAHVAVWNTLIRIGLTIPVTAFLESFKHEAIFNPDGDYWSWTYNFNAGGAIHKAELNAWPINDSMLWVMQISKQNGFQNFEWFRGKSANHRGGGWWILNEHPNNQNEILKIDWTHNNEGTGSVRYTNIKTSSPDYNGYIFYGSATLDLNRFYNIYSPSHSNLVEIEWSSDDHHGRIRDPHHFGDELWYCWSANLMDTECP